MSEDTGADWARIVATELDRLPPREAAAIRLVYNHRMPVSEAAAWLGLRRVDVNRLLADGLRRISSAITA